MEYKEVIVGVDVDVEEDADDDKEVLDEELKADIAPEAVAERIGIVGVFPWRIVEEQIGCVAEFAARMSGVGLGIQPATKTALVNSTDRADAATRMTQGAILSSPVCPLEANPT